MPTPTAQHTPGPWRIYKRSAIIHGPDGHEVALARCLAWPDPQAEANALLIAAAPDLLEACKAMETAQSMGLSSADAIRLARAVIAKATGGAS